MSELLTLRLKGAGEEALVGAIREKALLIADRIFARSQENLVAHKWPVTTFNGRVIQTIISDTGGLLKAGEVIQESNRILIRYSTPYANAIEYGLPPGIWVPIDALEAWAGRKLGAKGDNVAYAIQQKIYQMGTDPRPFLREALDHVVAEAR